MDCRIEHILQCSQSAPSTDYAFCILNPRKCTNKKAGCYDGQEKRESEATCCKLPKLGARNE
eukprot:1152897-Pelagomonas_calceolata.AAC.5